MSTDKFRAYTCNECGNQTVIVNEISPQDPAAHNRVYIDCPKCGDRLRHGGGNRYEVFEDWVDDDAIVRQVAPAWVERLEAMGVEIWNDKGVNVNTANQYEKAGHEYENADRRVRWGDRLQLTFTPVEHRDGETVYADEDRTVVGTAVRFGNFYKIETDDGEEYTVKDVDNARIDRQVRQYDPEENAINRVGVDARVVLLDPHRESYTLD